MCLKPKIAGYIYLTRTSAFRNSGETIYKLGKTMEYGGRFNGYDKFSELYVLYYVEDIDVIENILLQIFNRKYKNETAYGKEYFNGNVIDMLNTIKGMLDVYGLIHKVDLVEALFNDKLKRFIIYNSEEINADFYEMMNEIMIDKNVNIQINDVSNYNNFYYEYIMNNKKIYNNGKNNNKIKIDIKKVPKIKTILENDCDKINESKDKIKPILEYDWDKINESKDEIKTIIKNIENEINEEEDIENEVNEKEDIKNEVNENGINKYTIYICHHCIDYKSKYKYDMEKHLNKKKPCNSNTNISYEEAKLITLNKKYNFYFNYCNLSQNDFNTIINKYTDKENNIYENWLKNNHINNSKIVKNIDDNKEEIIDKFDKLYFDIILNKYKCPLCNTEYTSKQNMKKHILNQAKCDNIRKINDIIKLHKN